MATAIRKSLFTDINDRIERDKEEGDIAFCQALLLKLEFLTKVVTAGVVACLDDDRDRSRYSLERRLVRADSLGTWRTVLDEALVGSAAQCMRPGAREFVKDLTERVGRDDWRGAAVSQLKDAASSLATEVEIGAKESFRTMFRIAVEVRNRTRGHGAVRSDQCGDASPALERVLDTVEAKTLLLRLPWAYLRQNLSGKYRVTPLLGDPQPFEYLKKNQDDVRLPDGVYLHLEAGAGTFRHVPVRLVFSDSELRDVLLPNGNYRGRTKKFELLSYGTNDDRDEDGTSWSAPPNRQPESETQGLESLEAVGSILTNAPPLSAGYVPRPALEAELNNELLEPDRHRIVTLSGRGGIGKTALALKSIAELGSLETPTYDVVLWLSARDIDLLDAGPRPVSRRVFTQRDVARAAAEILERPDHSARSSDAGKFFESCLREGAEGGRTLFVIDNFETLQDPIEVFQWIDDHVRVPNKVLITTRSRDFRADFPIEVGGMTEKEAGELIDRRATALGIQDLSTPRYRRRLIEESEGHPYVIRLVLGEAAVQRKQVTPAGALSSANGVLDALFRRTFDALSAGAQRVFLLLSSWRVYVPEVAVEAVMLRRQAEHLDVAKALAEVVRYSLVERTDSEDARSAFVGVPLVAALFGARELEVSRHKPTVLNDRELLMDFGAGKKRDAHSGVGPRIENLIRRVAKRSSAGTGVLQGEDQSILEYLADRFPEVYWRLADLVAGWDESPLARDKGREYLKRFIVSASGAEKASAWERLADLRSKDGDAIGEVQALCEAAEFSGASLRKLSGYANRVNNVVFGNPQMRITATWLADREMLLGRLVAALEKRRNSLSATDCSRLAWLHVNAGNAERGIDIARMGAEKDPANEYCARFLERFCE